MYRHICRAKRIDNNEWVYGYYVALPEEYSHGKDVVHAIFTTECEHVCMGEYKDYGWYEVDPNSVGRYIGINDNNNQPIFEHDIILSQERDTRPYSKTKKSKRLKGVVYYHIGSGNRFYNKETQEWNRHLDYSAEWKVKFNEDQSSKYCYSSWGDFWDCEVIGNIVDNPELLEV